MFRRLLHDKLRRRPEVVDDHTYLEHSADMKVSMVNSLMHLVMSYIAWGRQCISGEGECSKLELEYMEGRLPMDFDDMSEDDQRQWLADNRETEDNALILYVIDNYERIELKRFRLQIFYILNALQMNERWFGL